MRLIAALILGAGLLVPMSLSEDSDRRFERDQWQGKRAYIPMNETAKTPDTVSSETSSFSTSDVAETVESAALDRPIRVPTPRLQPRPAHSSAPMLASHERRAGNARPYPRLERESAPLRPVIEAPPAREPLDLPTRPNAPKVDSNGPFGRVRVAFRDPERISGWRQVADAYGRDRDHLVHCLGSSCGDASLLPLARDISGMKSLGRYGQITAVNGLVNARGYAPDMAGDHWSAPLQTWQRGGDCEDLALLKMALLETLGIPAGDMAVAVGHTRAGRPHAVLSVQLGAQTLVLDNRLDTVSSDLAADFIPRYSVAEGRRDLHVVRRPAPQTDDVVRVVEAQARPNASAM